MRETPYHSLRQVFAPSISSYGNSVDTLFWVLCGITIFFVLGIALTMGYFCVKYRRSVRPDPPPRGEQNIALEVTWIVVPLVIVVSLYAWGAKLFLRSYSNAPDDSYEVFVVAKQWMWKFQHPNGTKEVDELHVPIGRPVRLVLISQDVIHDFFVPALRLKHDVLPMKYASMHFTIDQEGAFHFFCAQYCGTKHSQMIGILRPLKPEDFDRWLATSVRMNSPASRGKALLQSLGCRTCHRTDSLSIAPTLEGIYGRVVRLSDGSSRIADADYIRRSILLPASDIVANYQAVMPSFQGRVSEEELFQILAYLKSTSEGKVQTDEF